MMRHAAVLVILGALASGCLLKDELHTWYVDHTGAVAWVVIEKDVRSDAQAAFDREAEEVAYWTAVKSETHHMARGLRQLGAQAMRTRVLRAETPFTVVTEGRFAGLDQLGQRLIVHAGLSGVSIVRQHEGMWEWTLTASDPHATSGAGGDLDEGIAALVAGLDRLRVVLVSGRFEHAAGFELSQDRRIAILAEDPPASDTAMMTLTLRWK
jgi:hypothetical protein